MKHAFVSGSTKGIGKAVGMKLLQEGYHVIFNYCNSDEATKALEQEINPQFKGQYSILKTDLSDLNMVESVAEQIRSISNELDVLVFNTGLTDRSAFGEVKQDDWLRVFNANLNVPFFLMQSLKTNLRKKSSIIFVGSMLGNIPHSVSVSYGVSKSAIHSLVANMVKHLSADEIRINAIAPGFVDTDWQKDKPEWLREKIKGKVALKRFAKEEEVANMCFHMIQNEYLTGQTIQLDGGYSFE